MYFIGRVGLLVSYSDWLIAVSFQRSAFSKNKKQKRKIGSAGFQPVYM